ncbi:MAG: signal transduction histidine kinase [Firmicutes bacterium]|nr:signal transduction histidine kinase [Bacillota bacterium]
MHKLWAGMMVLVLLITASLAVFQVFFLKDLFIDSKVKNVSSSVYVTLNGQEISSASGISDKLDSLAYREDIALEIIDSRGNTIYINGQSPDSAGIEVNMNQTVGMESINVSLLAGNGSGSGGSSQQGSGTESSGSGGSSVETQVQPDSSAAAGQGYGKGSGVIQDGELKQRLIENGLAGKNAVEETVHPVYGFEVMVLSIAFKDAVGEDYVALATIPLAPIDEMIGIMNKVLALAAAVLLLLSGVLAFFMSRNLTRPVKKLTAAAGDIEKGNLESRVDIRSNDELGALGRTFNKMAERLQKTERLRKEIVENVSHELRTPLSIIKGYAETIRDVTGENKARRDGQLDIISQESDRLGVLVDDILDYSQIQSGLMELDVTNFDISEMIREIIRKYEVVLGESGMRIIFSGARAAAVRGDKVRIEQVLHNLIKNAINYSPDGRDIEVQVEDTGSRARVKISDHGVGIPEEELEFIWDRYYRTKGIKKRKIYGSGLGLSIVRSILEAHKAGYSVESREGSGTTFWFELDKSAE